MSLCTMSELTGKRDEGQSNEAYGILFQKVSLITDAGMESIDVRLNCKLNH